MYDPTVLKSSRSYRSQVVLGRLSETLFQSIQIRVPVSKLIFFKDCLKHDRNACHECKDVGMCDGQPADNCDFMTLHEFEYNFNVRSTKVNKQFVTIQNVVEAKKKALIEIYRKDPRISHDDAVSLLQRTIETFDLSNLERDRNLNYILQLEQQLNELKSSLSGRVVNLTAYQAYRFFILSPYHSWSQFPNAKHSFLALFP